VVRSNAVNHYPVQSLFDAASEFLTTGDDFHAEIVKVLTSHFHLGVFEMVGTPHLRSQIQTASFDAFVLGIELSVHRVLAQRSRQKPPAKHLEPTRLVLRAPSKQKRAGMSSEFL
jgi:hypothetical protein